jgi:hypothetical protein
MKRGLSDFCGPELSMASALSPAVDTGNTWFEENDRRLQGTILEQQCRKIFTGGIFVGVIDLSLPIASRCTTAQIDLLRHGQTPSAGV